MTFAEYIKEKFNLELPKEKEISAIWFASNGLPMVVECSWCRMTMASPNCYVTADGDIYCKECAGEK